LPSAAVVPLAPAFEPVGSEGTGPGQGALEALLAGL
jgi:hypothetical protein